MLEIYSSVFLKTKPRCTAAAQQPQASHGIAPGRQQAMGNPQTQQSGNQRHPASFIVLVNDNIDCKRRGKNEGAGGARIKGVDVLDVGHAPGGQNIGGLDYLRAARC